MYIDVRFPSFLLEGLSLGEAWRIGPRRIRESSLLPVRDGSANRVFHGKAKHILVEKPAAKEVVAEEPDFEESNSKMVVRRRMTVDRFIPGG